MRPRTRTPRIMIVLLMLSIMEMADAQGKSATASTRRDWPGYGGGPEQIRYSRLKQINRSNVARLEGAWTYHTAARPGPSQTQPTLADPLLFAFTPNPKLV